MAYCPYHRAPVSIAISGRWPVKVRIDKHNNYVRNVGKTIIYNNQLSPKSPPL